MILTDTGFWVALLVPRDKLHAQATGLLRQYEDETLVTSWPVLAEACHLMERDSGISKAIEFVGHVRAGACQIVDLPPSSLARIQTLMHKYSDLPMDLADASLVALAEQLGEGRILSTDERDFKAYRWKNTKPFKNLLLSN